MSSVILGYEDKPILCVSNQRLKTLIDFALAVAAARPEGRESILRLREFWDRAFSGINFGLAERFPSVEEQKFWATCFLDVARRIFLRELGNQEITYWQGSAIADAHILARALIERVRFMEPDWWPVSEDRMEGERY